MTRKNGKPAAAAPSGSGAVVIKDDGQKQPAPDSNLKQDELASQPKAVQPSQPGEQVSGEPASPGTALQVPQAGTNALGETTSQEQAGNQVQPNPQSAPAVDQQAQGSQSHTDQSGSDHQVGPVDAVAARDAEQDSSSTFIPKSTRGLEITSSRDGFWRAGHQWSTTKTVVPLDELTDAQIEQLTDEPVLRVRFVHDIADCS